MRAGAGVKGRLEFFSLKIHPFAQCDSTQSPKNLVGMSALPTGKFLHVQKVFVRTYKIGHKIKPQLLKSFQTVWKVSGLSGKFPDSLESLQTVWKISG